MNEEVPKYLVIAQYYRDQTASGALTPGVPLDSRRKLAKAHKISRVTMDKVIELLTREGVLEPSDGNRPPVVADPLLRIATVQNRVRSAATTGRALGVHETTRILQVEMVPCPADIASALGVKPGEEVLCRERVNLINGEPVATGCSYYPPEVMEVTPELREPVSMPSGSRELAAKRMGSRQNSLIRRTTARLATEREREVLKLDGAYSVVTQQDRQVILKDGRTVEVAVKVGEGSRPIVEQMEL